MARLLSYIAALTLASLVVAECGAGSPHAVVDGRNGSFVTTAGNNEIYTGPDFYKAITTGLDSLKSGDVSLTSTYVSHEASSISHSLERKFSFDMCCPRPFMASNRY